MNETDKARIALLKCLGAADPSEVAASLRALSPGDWERLARKAAAHMVEPLLYRVLAGMAGGPAEVLAGLRRRYRATTIRNLRGYHEIEEILSALNAEGIPVILLKGAHLARFVYRDIGLRPMSDVDILVRESDVARARQSLLALGYRHPEYTFHGPKHLHPLTKPRALPLEVHWTIIPGKEPVAVDVDALWDDARRAAIGGNETLVLCPEHLVLHLCLHAAYNHGFVAGIRPLCDIAETIGRFKNDIDWDKACSTAERWGMARSVSASLHLARDLLSLKIPGGAAALVDRHAPPERILFISREQVFSVEGCPRESRRRGEGRYAPQRSRLGRIWKSERQGDGRYAPQRSRLGRLWKSERRGDGKERFGEPRAFRRRVRFLCRVLFPPPDQMRVIYQTRLILPAYLIRPFHLFLKYLPLPRRPSSGRKTERGRAMSILRSFDKKDAIRSWIASPSNRKGSDG